MKNEFKALEREFKTLSVKTLALSNMQEISPTEERKRAIAKLIAEMMVVNSERMKLVNILAANIEVKLTLI